MATKPSSTGVVSSAASKADTLSGSVYGDSPIMKVTDKTLARPIKYVFIGPVPEVISSALQKLSKHGIQNVSKAEYFSLTGYFGVDWEYSLGVYRFHLYSGLTEPTDFVRDPHKFLKDSKIHSFQSFKKLKHHSDTLLNCARRVYMNDILAAVGSFKTDFVKFVFTYRLRLNDDIRVIKKKICAQFNHLGYIAIPEWQHLWHGDQEQMGCDIIDRSQGDRFVHMPADPIKQFISLLNRRLSVETEKFIDKSFRIQKHNDTLLHDYFPIKKNEIDVCILPSYLQRISKSIDKLPIALQNPIEFFKAFLKRFFTEADKTNVLLILQSGSQPYDVIADSQKFVDISALNTRLKYEEESLSLLESCKPIPLSASHLQTISSFVSCGQSFPTIDLEKIFDASHVDDLLVFVATKSGRKSADAFFSKFKLKRDMSLWKDSASELKSWLFPSDEARKANTLAFRFKLIPVKNAMVSLIFQENGDYKINVHWNIDDHADLLTFRSVLKCLSRYFAIFDNINYKVDRQAKLKIVQPRFCMFEDLTCVQNVQIKNLTHRLIFKCARPFKYQSFRQVAALAQTYLALSEEHIDINRFWKRTTRFSSVIAKLEQMNLYNLSALVDLSNNTSVNGWKSLDLVPNSKANSSLIEEFRRYIDVLTSNHIGFYFKKHSRYETLTVQRKVVNDFLKSQKVSFQDAIDNSELYSALFVELRRKLQITTKEALDFLTDFKDSFNESDASQKIVHLTSGIRCDVSMQSATEYKVLVHGVRNFTQRSSVSFLLRDISDCFSRLFCLYQRQDLQSLLKIHRHLWQDPYVLQDDSSNIHKQSDAGIDIDIDDDFDDIEISALFDSDDFGIPHQDGIPSRPAMLSDRQTIAHENADIADPSDSSLYNDLTSDKTSATNLLPFKPSASKGSYHLSRLQLRDPYLFKPNSKLKRSFATKCQKNFFVQPIILTPDEFAAQDKTAFKVPRGTPEGFKYRNYYYICPEIWCPKSEKAVHPDQLSDQVWSNTDLNFKGEPVPKIISGICPDGEKAIVSNDGIGGWKAKNISDKDPSQGRKEFPGFLTGLHPDGIGVPCCFQNDRSVGPSAPQFFALLAGEPVSKSKTAESSRRYRLKASKVPLNDNRFGDLSLELDYFFNKSPPEDPDQSKIYHEGYSRFLRLGIDQSKASSFLNCVRTVFNLHHAPSQLSLDAFKARLSFHLDDQLLFDSLKNGNLKLIFQDFSDDNAIAKFRQYLEISPDIDKDYIWGLVSAPLNWLFPSGLNIFVFRQDSHGKFFVDTPSGERLSEFYRPSAPGVFFFTDGNIFEPIVHVDHRLRSRALFEPADSYDRVRALIPKSFSQSSAAFDAFHILENLSRHTYPAPIAQYVNDFNKISFFELPDDIMIPVDCFHGPIWHPVNSSLRMKSVKTVKPFNAKKIITNLPVVSKVLRFDLAVSALIPDTLGKPAAILLNTGHVIPVSDAKSFLKTYNLSKTLIHDGDRDARIFEGSVITDERILQVEHVNFIKSSLDRLKYELADLLNRDLQHSSAKAKSPLKMWFQIQNILSGVDASNLPLSVKDKTFLLSQLFLSPRSGIIYHIVDTQKSDTTSHSSEKSDRACSQPIGINAVACNRRTHCTWTGKCKLYIPKEYLFTFTSLLIDDIIRSNIGRDVIMQHRIESLVTADKISVSSDQIVFDDDVIQYVLYLLNHFDLRLLRQSGLPDFQVRIDTSSSDQARLLKEHLIFDALVDPVVFQIEQAHKSLSDLPSPWYNSFPERGILDADVIDVLPYLISLSSDDSKSFSYSKYQFRQDIINSFLSERVENRKDSTTNPTLLWKRYLVLAKSSDKSFSSQTTLKQLSSTLSSDKHKCNLGDIFMLSKLFPFKIVILNRSLAKTIGSADVDCLRTIMIFVDSTGNIRLVASKSKSPPACFFF